MEVEGKSSIVSHENLKYAELGGRGKL